MVPSLSSSTRARAFYAGLIFVASFGAAAQPSAPAVLSPVVVTATRSPQDLSATLADVTVIERDEIIRAGPDGLSGLLQRQPGVEITRNGGPGGVTGVFVRGTNRVQTVVLVDGVRIGSASSGAATLEAIPLDNIERIEILRGPASGLYGADAIGGVIQIFTREPAGTFSGSARAGYGTYDTREATGSISGTAGPLQLSVQAAHQASRGFNSIVDPADFSFNPDRDGYVRDSGSVRLALPWATDQSLSGGYLRSRLNAQFDSGPGFDDRTITVLETASVESRNRLAAWWLSRLTLAQSVDDSLSRTAFGDFPFRTRQRQLSWLSDLMLPVGALTLGYDRREEHIASETGFGVTDRDTNAFLALYQWQLAAHAVQLNVRHDQIDQLGGHTTGGVRYAFQASPGAQYVASFSTAFKAPTFNDLYFPGFSNPHLAPETARNLELGATFRGEAWGSSWQAHAVGYYNRVRDLIVFLCDGSFNCAPQNVSRATLEGVTLSLDARRGGSFARISVDLAYPHDDQTGNLLQRRARQHGTVEVRHEIGPVRLGAEFVASSARYDDVDNRVRLPGYGIVNLTAEWNLRHGWSMLLRGDNVLDRDYQLAAHYGTGGARVFAALRWQG